MVPMRGLVSIDSCWNLAPVWMWRPSPVIQMETTPRSGIPVLTGRHRKVYEIRTYDLRVGALSDTLEAGETSCRPGPRSRGDRPCMRWMASSFTHIWPYELRASVGPDPCGRAKRLAATGGAEEAPVPMQSTICIQWTSRR